MRMEFKFVDGETSLFVDDENITPYLFNKDLLEPTSRIASIPELREKLLQIQRETCKDGGFVVEGRDIGTIVFPQAKWKFFLEANMETKIRRALKQTKEALNVDYSREEIKEILKTIDEKDANRDVAPLTTANDTLIYDNSNSPSAEQDAIVLWYYITHEKEILDNSRTMLKKNEDISNCGS
jgi:cytidylate kinase